MFARCGDRTSGATRRCSKPAFISSPVQSKATRNLRAGCAPAHLRLDRSPSPALTVARDWTATGNGSSLAWTVARLALAIEIASTCKAAFCSAAPARGRNAWTLAVEVEDEDIARQCLTAAHAAIQAAIEDTPIRFRRRTRTPEGTWRRHPAGPQHARHRGRGAAARHSRAAAR